MQGTAGFFSTVNTRETNWILTEQERGGYKEEQEWEEYQYTENEEYTRNCTSRTTSR